MSFDEEYIDPHGECAHEIHRLCDVLKKRDSQFLVLLSAAKTLNSVRMKDNLSDDHYRIVQAVIADSEEVAELIRTTL